MILFNAIFIIIILIIYLYCTKQAHYIIIYSTDIDGKHQVDSCSYTIPIRKGLPNNEEVKNYVKSLLLDSTNLRIIDIHEL